MSREQTSYILLSLPCRATSLDAKKMGCTRVFQSHFLWHRKKGKRVTVYRHFFRGDIYIFFLILFIRFFFFSCSFCSYVSLFSLFIYVFSCIKEREKKIYIYKKIVRKYQKIYYWLGLRDFTRPTRVPKPDQFQFFLPISIYERKRERERERERGLEAFMYIYVFYFLLQWIMGNRRECWP